MRRGVLAILLLASRASAGTPPDSSLNVAPADEPGARLIVSGTVVDSASRPVPGAEIHVYQTDATGAYTRERAMDERHARLSGWLKTDAHGRFELRTIRPGRYPRPLRLGDRERRIPAHIHMDVTAAGMRERRLQAVFADDPLLADPYWRDWVERLRQPVLEPQAGGDGVRATLAITLETARP